jgi:hypothetical protein
MYFRFPIQDDHGNALASLHPNFILQYVSRKIHEKQVALDLNGTHQFQYANEVKFIKQVINTWFW